MTFRALNTDFEEVVIIDVLPEEERRNWRISEDLRDDLASMGIQQIQVSCSTKKHVFDALGLWCGQRLEGSNFILHFTAHGNENGIGLKATREFIAWHDLSAPLRELNRKMQGSLVLNMMACKGIYGTSILNLQDEHDPFFGIIGPQKNIPVDQAKRVAKTFYAKMRDAIEIPNIISDINKSEQDEVLWCNSAQFKRQAGGQAKC